MVSSFFNVNIVVLFLLVVVGLLEQPHGLLVDTCISISQLSDNITINIDRVPSLDTKIVFLKSHKTGSSSVSGLLWRELCVRQKRHCFLPPPANPGKTWSFKSSKDKEIVSSSLNFLNRGPPYDVWLHHFRMDDYLFQTVMNIPFEGGSRPEIKFLSIVRHPAERFRSAWSWYQHSNTTFAGIGGLTLERFAQLMSFPSPSQSLFASHNASAGAAPHCDLHTYATAIRDGYVRVRDALAAGWVRGVASKGFRYRTGLEATSEELVGLRSADPAFPKQFKQLLKDVERGRVLLLVCDRFPESLLLLDKLGLAGGNRQQSFEYLNQKQTFPFPHLLYLPQKAQRVRERMSALTAAQLQRLQPHDCALYSAANLALDRLLQLAYPDRAQLQSALQRLAAQTEAVAAMCAQGGGINTVATDRKYVVESEIDRHALCESLRKDNRELVQEEWHRKLLQSAVA